MDLDIILGIVITLVAYGFILYLTLWSRKTIDTIAEKKLGTLREIVEDLRHGK